MTVPHTPEHHRRADDVAEPLPVTSGDVGAAAADFGEFDAFYRSERPRLVRLAHLLTGSVGVGEELAQEALLAVHARWATLDSPAGYARRALVNLSRSYHRRRGIEWRHHRGADPSLMTHALAPELDETWAVIRGLPAAQRAVVVLRFYEDLSLSQIAELLDQPVGTVKSSLHRALARLKEVLA